MNAITVSILLCIPFLLVGTITGVIYFISGYKKGLYRSLFSLGITVISILISLLLANILAALLSGPISGLVPTDGFADDFGVFSSFAENMLQSIIKVILAFVLFVILLLIALIVLKLVGNRIKWDKLDMKDPEDKKLKLSGMAVRAIDTLLVTFMLLLPIYGSLAVIMPTATVISTTAVENGDPQAPAHESNTNGVDIVDAINRHPLVSAYRFGPGDWVMRGLSGMGKDSGNLNAIEAVEVFGEASSLLGRFSALNGEERFTALSDLCIFLKENAVEERWCYDLICAAKAELEKQIALVEDENDPDIAVVRNYLDLLDLSREEFEDNAGALLDFVIYALDNGFAEFYEINDYSLLSDDFYTELGSLLNSTPQAIALKKIYYFNAAQDIIHSTDRDRDNYEYALSRATELMDDYFGDGTVSENEYGAEGEAFMLILNSGSSSNEIDSFVRNPLFGPDSINEFITSDLVAESWEFRFNSYFYQKDLFKSNETVTAYFRLGLSEYADISIRESRFSDHIHNVTSVYSYCSNEKPGSTECTVIASPAAMKVLSDTCLADIIAKTVNPCGSNLRSSFDALYEMVNNGASYAEPVNIGFMPLLVHYGKNPEIWPDRIVTKEECGECYSYYDEETDSYVEEYENPEAYADYEGYALLKTLVLNIVTREGSADILKHITETSGRDPYGISSYLSAAEYSVFEDICSNAYESISIDPEKVDHSLDGTPFNGYYANSGIASGSISIQVSGSDSFTVDSGVIGNFAGNGIPYGATIETSENGALIISVPTEEEINASNDALMKKIEIIKAFIGL
ncbi:MAG: hypothetical protein IJD22_06630 [Clostridia bacterium]|nr:hypothetical protein [Clostridia bacterium]